ncbi:mitochondrial carrier domain-containing protein [Suillus lakei]|nr:mitochondrial carrier domain-containing protein [Suillus lakei]
MSESLHRPSFFPTTALDHAAAGLGAGVVGSSPSFKLQVATTNSQGGIGKAIWNSLREIHANEGCKGLYRGVGPNIAGNASSWGLYFLFYNMLKKRAAGDDPNYRMSPGAYLLCSAQASAATAIMTNPIWVVKVRMFTTRADSPTSYRSLSDGLASIWRQEGFSGLWQGTIGFGRREQRCGAAGKVMGPEDDKLSNTSYTLMSGASKLWALALTYPYQVIRSRIQNNATAHLYPDIPTAIKRAWQGEGVRGFYRGMGANLVRVLPGTCVTFVAYENLAWLLRTSAARREAKRRDMATKD